MARAELRRRLIVNADDFGRSSSINRAVVDAHQRGILTTASLMVNGEAFDEAVQLAKSNPRLGVGLHLTLCCGSATLPPESISKLVNRRGEFRESPVAAGMVYFFSTEARRQLRREIAAQFDRFEQTGLTLDHVNGHLHFHLHPAVFQILKDEVRKRRVRSMRLTRDPGTIDLPLGSGRWFYRLSHWVIFRLLSAMAHPFFASSGMARTDYVFGLLENARVDADYVQRLLPKLPAGTSELYSHPSLDEFRNEYEALLSPEVQRVLKEENITLIRYQDLWASS